MTRDPYNVGLADFIDDPDISASEIRLIRGRRKTMLHEVPWNEYLISFVQGEGLPTRSDRWVLFEADTPELRRLVDRFTVRADKHTKQNQQQNSAFSPDSTHNSSISKQSDNQTGQPLEKLVLEQTPQKKPVAENVIEKSVPVVEKQSVEKQNPKPSEKVDKVASKTPEKQSAEKSAPKSSSKSPKIAPAAVPKDDLPVEKASKSSTKSPKITPAVVPKDHPPVEKSSKSSTKSPKITPAAVPKDDPPVEKASKASTKSPKITPAVVPKDDRPVEKSSKSSKSPKITPAVVAPKDDPPVQKVSKASTKSTAVSMGDSPIDLTSSPNQSVSRSKSKAQSETSAAVAAVFAAAVAAASASAASAASATVPASTPSPVLTPATPQADLVPISIFPCNAVFNDNPQSSETEITLKEGFKLESNSSILQDTRIALQQNPAVMAAIISTIEKLQAKQSAEAAVTAVAQRSQRRKSSSVQQPAARGVFILTYVQTEPTDAAKSPVDTKKDVKLAAKKTPDGKKAKKYIVSDDDDDDMSDNYPKSSRDKQPEATPTKATTPAKATPSAPKPPVATPAKRKRRSTATEEDDLFDPSEGLNNPTNPTALADVSHRLHQTGTAAAAAVPSKRSSSRVSTDQSRLADLSFGALPVSVDSIEHRPKRSKSLPVASPVLSAQDIEVQISPPPTSVAVTAKSPAKSTQDKNFSATPAKSAQNKNSTATPAKSSSKHVTPKKEVIVEDPNVYYVEKILDIRHSTAPKQRSRGVEFFIKWKGYPNPEDCTWEPLNHLTTYFSVVHRWCEKHNKMDLWKRAVKHLPPKDSALYKIWEAEHASSKTE